MRIALISDSHFVEGPRFDECLRVHDWIADDVGRRGVDLILHGGDVFDRRSSVRERAAVADWLQCLAMHAPVVIVRGNHDQPGDLELFQRLESYHPIRVLERPGVHTITGPRGEWEIGVAGLPWPSRAALAAHLGVDSRELLEQGARQALEGVLLGLRQQLERIDGPRILLAHAQVVGAKTSTGQPLVGCDLEVTVGDLATAGADVIALGHVHRPQEWFGPAIYAGSPYRTSFGEIEPKGYVLFELDPPLDVQPRPDRFRFERVETPCTPMLLFEGRVEQWPVGATLLADGSAHPVVRGAEIRFRYQTPADAREFARRAAEGMREHWLAEGAVRVELDEQVTTAVRARAPEVAQAPTIESKLRALWAARGEELGFDREVALVRGALELEQEVRDAA